MIKKTYIYIEKFSVKFLFNVYFEKMENTAVNPVCASNGHNLGVPSFSFRHHCLECGGSTGTKCTVCGHRECVRCETAIKLFFA